MDPATIASLAMGGTSMLKGLFGGGGGGATPNITKQDNTQATSVNVSIGDLAGAVRASLPFPGATPASFATPIGYSAEGYYSPSSGGGIMQTIQDNWLIIAAGLGVAGLGVALVMKKKLRAA